MREKASISHTNADKASERISLDRIDRRESLQSQNRLSAHCCRQFGGSLQRRRLPHTSKVTEDGFGSNQRFPVGPKITIKR